MANIRLQAEVDALAPYRVIRDAEAEAERILHDTRNAATEVHRSAQQQFRTLELAARDALERADRTATEKIVEAEEQASRVRSRAKEVLVEADSRVESIMGSVHAEAKAVIENATRRAKEIAGTAFEAVQNAERYEQVAKAMKNLIEGYGDEYVVPSTSLLDDLAEEYGFLEAGQELKNARERTRQMVKNMTAATCDYVEANRRETAIRFVVDAFNGKVDSILTPVKDVELRLARA